jgi:hypothetical protein
MHFKKKKVVTQLWTFLTQEESLQKSKRKKVPIPLI